MRLRGFSGGNPVAAALLAAGLVIAVFAAAAGCSHPAQAPGGSVKACIQFGDTAVRQHVTVTSLPPACEGLTKAQIDFAVGSALHSAAIGVRGKAAQRKRIAEASHFLAQLATNVPRQHSQPPLSAAPAGQASRAVLGLLALCSWVITVALGLWMMARWMFRRGPRAKGKRFRRAPLLNLAHLVPAAIGLAVWIGYLASGVIGLAWAGCVLVMLATGLGMALAFLPLAGTRPEGAPVRPAATGRRAPVISLGAHIVFATLTILLTFLTAAGVG